MRSLLVWCIGANFAVTLLALGVMCVYPSGSGFTFTSPATTRFVQGGPLIAALLIICVSGGIAVYLAFRVYEAL
jgi:hypothetical protein